MFSQSIEQIILLYSAKIIDKKIFFKPNIPKDKLHNALNYYANSVSEEDVLVLLDNTVYGTFKDGAVLTASGLYVHNYFEDPKHMPLADITEVSLVGNIQCKVYINGLKYLDASAPGRDAMEKFTKMIQEIILVYHPEKHRSMVIPDATMNVGETSVHIKKSAVKNQTISASSDEEYQLVSALKKENISVLVFDLWSTTAPPNPKSFCQQILENRYPGASLWSHFMVGYRDNLTVEDSSKEYRQLVFDGRLPDLGKEIGSFKWQTPNGNVFVVLFFSPKIEPTKVEENQQFPTVLVDYPRQTDSMTTIDPDYPIKCLTQNYIEQEESRNLYSYPEFQKALDYLIEGRNVEARTEAEALAQKFPDLADTYNWWAQVFLIDCKYTEARSVLSDGLSKSKRKYPLLNLMGEVEWKSGSLAEAVYWWIQGLICQQTRQGFGEEVGAYLYLYHVAETLDLSTLATQLRERVDFIRPGKIRLSPAAADNLATLARTSDTTQIKKALGMIEAKYFAPSPQSGPSSKQDDEIPNLIRISQDRSEGYDARGKAIQRLAEVGDSRAIGPLMQIYNTELHLIRLDAKEAVGKIRLRSR